MNQTRTQPGNTLKRDHHAYYETHQNMTGNLQYPDTPLGLVNKKAKMEYPIRRPDDMEKLSKEVKSLPLAPNYVAFDDRINYGKPVVDKTDVLFDILQTGAIAVTGPRRFGKSFVVSTFEAIFTQGEEWWKEKCADFAISKKGYSFPVHPVLRLDFSATLKVRGIKRQVMTAFKKLFENKKATAELELLQEENLNDRKNPEDDEFLSFFEPAIQKLAKLWGVGVVILIDEYDAPFSDLVIKVLERDLNAASNLENENTIDEMRTFVRSFLTRIKSLRGRGTNVVHFVYLTGIIPLKDLGMFSGANDILSNRVSPQYLGVLGYTEEEILNTFNDNILAAAVQKFTLGKAQIKPEDLTKEDKEAIITIKVELVHNMRLHYNGYLFHMDNLVTRYSPYSINTLLHDWQCSENSIGKYTGYFAGSGSSKLIWIALQLAPLATIQKFFWALMSDSILPLAEFTKEDLTSNQTISCLYEDPIKLCFWSGIFTVDEGYSEDNIWRLNVVNREMRESLLSDIRHNLKITQNLASMTMNLYLGKYLKFFESFNEELKKISAFAHLSQAGKAKDSSEVEAYGHTIFAFLLGRVEAYNQTLNPNFINSYHLHDFRWTKDKAVSELNFRPDISFSFNKTALIIEFKCLDSVEKSLEEAKEDLLKKYADIQDDLKPQYSYLKDCKKVWIAGALGFGILQAIEIYELKADELELKEGVRFDQTI